MRRLATIAGCALVVVGAIVGLFGTALIAAGVVLVDRAVLVDAKYV